MHKLQQPSGGGSQISSSSKLRCHVLQLRELAELSRGDAGLTHIEFSVGVPEVQCRKFSKGEGDSEHDEQGGGDGLGDHGDGRREGGEGDTGADEAEPKTKQGAGGREGGKAASGGAGSGELRSGERRGERPGNH